MSKRFADIAVGDQLEMPRGRYALPVSGDPEMPHIIGVVTHRWFDPVDDKEYVGIAYLKSDGSVGKPREKRTITGVARSGWRAAGRDWIAHVAALRSAEEEGAVVPLAEGGRLARLRLKMMGPGL